MICDICSKSADGDRAFLDARGLTGKRKKHHTKCKGCTCQHYPVGSLVLKKEKPSE